MYFLSKICIHYTISRQRLKKNNNLIKCINQYNLEEIHRTLRDEGKKSALKDIWDDKWWGDLKYAWVAFCDEMTVIDRGEGFKKGEKMFSIRKN